MQNNTFIAIKKNYRIELQMRTIQFRWKITELTWKLLNMNRNTIYNGKDQIYQTWIWH